MNGNEWFVLYTPFVSIGMSSIMLYWLYRIYKITKDWITVTIMWIPFSIAVVYTWIGFWNPLLEDAKNGLRFTIAFSLGIGCYISYSYAKKLLRILQVGEKK